MKIKTLLFSMSIAVAITANSATYYVSPEGSGSKDGSSPENAFDVQAFTTQAAANENGDIYYFAGGTYYITAPITFPVKTGASLIGNPEKDNPTIFSGGNNISTLIYIETQTGANSKDAPISISNIDFTGATSNTTQSTTYIGAFTAVNSGWIEITDCNFYRNTSSGSQGGPAVCGFRSTIFFKNCQFYDNSSAGRGGVFRLSSSIGTTSDSEKAKGVYTFENCVFKNNTNSGEMGGVIFASSFNSINIINCTAYGNSAAKLGGFLFCNAYSPTNGYNAQVNIISSTIAGNSASDAQISTRPSAHINIINSIIPSNDVVSSFAYSNATGFSADNFAFVSGGYNYIGSMASTPGEITWADTDNYGEDYTDKAIFGENTLNDENVLIPAVFYLGATGQQVSSAVAEWTLPAGLTYETDQLGNERSGEVTPGAVAVNIDNYYSYYLVGTMYSEYSEEWQPNPSYQFEKGEDGTYTITVGEISNDDQFEVAAVEDGEISKYYGLANGTASPLDNNYEGTLSEDSDFNGYTMQLQESLVNVTFTFNPSTKLFTVNGTKKNQLVVTTGNDKTMQSGDILDATEDGMAGLISMVTVKENGASIRVYAPQGTSNIYYYVQVSENSSENVESQDDDYSIKSSAPRMKVTVPEGATFTSATVNDEGYAYVSLPMGEGVVYLATDEDGSDAIAYQFEVTKGIPTGVDAIFDADTNAPIFNIFGQRVDESYRGIVIRNGKKFIQR